MPRKKNLHAKRIPKARKEEARFKNTDSRILSFVCCSHFSSDLQDIYATLDSNYMSSHCQGWDHLLEGRSAKRPTLLSRQPRPRWRSFMHAQILNTFDHRALGTHRRTSPEMGWNYCSFRTTGMGKGKLIRLEKWKRPEGLESNRLDPHQAQSNNSKKTHSHPDVRNAGTRAFHSKCALRGTVKGRSIRFANNRAAVFLIANGDVCTPGHHRSLWNG